MCQSSSGLSSKMLKIFSLLLACDCAIQHANNFIKYNLTQAIENRVVIISKFVTKEEVLKNRVIELKTNEDKKKNNSSNSENDIENKTNLEVNHKE